MKIVVSAAAVLALALSGFGVLHIVMADAEPDTDRIYITDRRGERWDITQAVSLGFKPAGFQFGIGRDAIRPLDESALDDGVDFDRDNARIIGVENGTDAHAYVVRRLTRHEIANTQLGETPIAAAY